MKHSIFSKVVSHPKRQGSLITLL